LASLKDRTITGFLWSFSGNFANQLVTFIVGILLARILSPREYGLIGMITIFIVISQTIIDSGLRQALIRKNDCTEADYSSVFYYNVFLSILLYCLLYLCAPYISKFYGEPELQRIIKVLGLILLFGSLSAVHSTILIKQLNFKLQSKISVGSALISGLIGIVLAYKGFGVWSLVYRQLAGTILTSLFYWIFHSWVPRKVFQWVSLKDLFGFSLKFLLSRFIDQSFWNIYYVIIGKVFSVKELGLYTRAEMFKNLPSQNLTSLIANVSLPALVQSQENKTIRENYRKVLGINIYLASFMLFMIISTANSMVLALLGEKWSEMIPVLKLLCLSGLLYPASILAINVFTVKGDSSLILRLEFVKKGISLLLILAFISGGLRGIIFAIVISSVIDFLLNGFYSGRLIGYKLTSQIKDILQAMIIPFLAGVLVLLLGNVMSIDPIAELIIQCCTGLVILFFIGEILKSSNHNTIKELVINTLQKIKK